MQNQLCTYRKYNGTDSQIYEDYINKYGHPLIHFLDNKKGWIDEIRHLHWINVCKAFLRGLRLPEDIILQESDVLNIVQEKQLKLHLVTSQLHTIFTKKRQQSQDNVVKMIILKKTGMQM